MFYQSSMLVYSYASLINIAIRSENTSACTAATNKPCICTMIGTIAGMVPRLSDKKLVSAAPPPIAIARSSHPDHMFPKSLPPKDITLASCPMMSSIPIKRDMMISNNLVIQSTIERGILPCGKR